MHLDMSRNYISKKVKMTSNVEYMKHYFVNKHLEDLEKQSTTDELVTILSAQLIMLHFETVAEPRF